MQTPILQHLNIISPLERGFSRSLQPALTWEYFPDVWLMEMIRLSRCIHKIISILGQYPPQGYIHPIINSTTCAMIAYCKKILIQMLIRKFKSDPHMKTNLSDSKVVLDPDLIDLTMIPPPMTPDEEGPSRIFPGTASAVSTPPTPFADRQSLEAELQVSQALPSSHVTLHKILSPLWGRVFNMRVWEAISGTGRT